MILAMDPGKDKTGAALVEEDGSLLWKGIIASAALEKNIRPRLAEKTPRAVIMGNGTRHQDMKRRMEELLKKEGLSLPVLLVNERYTTEMGEAAYWKDHPAKGLSRLIPKGMRTPPVPVDDYVAWIIGRIYLGLVKAEDVGHKKV
ncbi:MAG: ribonuclease H [Dialister sp.]|nr:ribonuclease H [Dialister sp.]